MYLLLLITFLKIINQISIQNEINKFENIPLTLISGKFIHKPNSNLFSNGYGLPILPLEHFNILNLKVKKKLMVSFFKINKSHLILCTINCEFYGSDKDYNYYNKIFLGDDIN